MDTRQLRGALSVTIWAVFLLLALLGYPGRVTGQPEKILTPFYSWKGHEAPDRKLLDMQVIAFVLAEPVPLEQSPRDEGFVKIVKMMTAEAILTLRGHHSSFKADAAAAFSILIQAGASQLVKDRADTDKVRAAAIKAEGFVVWMLVGPDLEPLQGIQIALDVVERSLSAFCPIYPFC